MRKLYSILALAATLTATAATPQLQTGISIKKQQSSLLEINNMQPAKAALSGMQKIARENEEDEPDYNIEGAYLMYIGDWFLKSSTGTLQTVEGYITDNGDGTVTITNEDFFVNPVTAAYDAETYTVTFNEVKLGKTDVGGTSYYIKFATGIVNQEAGEDEDAFVQQSITATYNPELKTLEFPDNNFFMWGAYLRSTYSDISLAGYLSLFEVVGFEKGQLPPIDEEQAGQWVGVGNATFVDAWVTTVFRYNDGTPVDPTELPFEVELQQNVDNENLYRLWAPYHAPGFELADLNTSTYMGQIVFDITDPQHVIVKPGYPAGANIGQGEMYNFGLLGWQIWGYGGSVDEETLQGIYDFMEQNGQAFDTYEDGVLTVNRSVFDLDKKCSSAYTWQNAATYVSTITFPTNVGISNVETSDAPAVYYNLQGTRVANPEGMVIRIQNGKATKMLVK